MVKTVDNNKKVKVKVKTFEVKEYTFLETHKGFTNKFKMRDELYDRYKHNKETSLGESLKLFDDVKKISSKDVSLVIVKDHSQNTLKLALATKIRVEEMRLNL